MTDDTIRRGDPIAAGTVRVSSIHEYLKWADDDDDNAEPFTAAAWREPDSSTFVHWSIPLTDDDFRDWTDNDTGEAIFVDMPVGEARELLADQYVWDRDDPEYSMIDYQHAVEHRTVFFVVGAADDVAAALETA